MGSRTSARHAVRGGDGAGRAEPELGHGRQQLGFVGLECAGANGGSAITATRSTAGTSAGGESLLTTVGVVTSYTDSTVVNGVTYFYKVSAVNAVGTGVLSNERSATPSAGVTVPGAPSLNSATAGNNSVSLGWSAGANGGSAITAYRVYRGTSSGGETLLTTVGVVTSYTDATVVNGVTYFYKVSAVNAVGEGVLSNERSATPRRRATVPGAPTLNSATAGNNSVTLGWSAGANGGSAITGYRVYRGTSAGGESLLTTVGVVTGYTDCERGQRCHLLLQGLGAERGRRRVRSRMSAPRRRRRRRRCRGRRA